MSQHQEIKGDRGMAQMHLIRPLAQRLPNYLASGVIVAVGAVLLVGYFLQVSRHAKQSARPEQNNASHLGRSEMKLPSLGTAPAPMVKDTNATLTGVEQSGLQLSTVDAIRLGSMDTAPIASHASPDIPRSAPVVVRGQGFGAASTTVDAVPPSNTRSSELHSGDSADVNKPISVVAATVLPTRRWLLPKGSFLNCVLETAIDSTLPGFATCVIGTDIYGADGRVVLLERGSRLIGELRTDVRAGQTRVMVIWNEARTPTGVVVNLMSPATDALGRSGVPGQIDRHTAERFGAAVMLSMFDAGVTAVTTHAQGSGGIVYNAQASHDIASEALKDSIGIAPTIRVATGARLSVTVVRDLDFRSVYGLTDHVE